MSDATEETGACEICEAAVPVEDLIQHVDVSLCPKCDAKWRERFTACAHQWEPHQGDWDAGRYCTRCAAFVEDEDAMTLFPLICDGWVEVVDA